MNSQDENFIINQQLSYSLTTMESAVCRPPTDFWGAILQIFPIKQYDIIILDINLITVSALSMDAMVVKPVYLAQDRNSQGFSIE